MAHLLSLDGQRTGLGRNRGTIIVDQVACRATSGRHTIPRIRTHPGEYLSEEYLKPLKLSAADLAEAIGVPPARIAEIVRGQQGVSADTALRLGRYFRTTPHFWITLQAGYDLSKAEAEIDLSAIGPRAVESADA